MKVSRRQLVLGGAATVLLPASLASAVPVSRSLKALLIGIGDYSNARPLKNAVEDVRAISARLATFGYEITILENASYQEMSDAIGRFSSELGGDTSAIFYFAGHGFQIGGSSYLLAKDARTSSKSAALAGAFALGEVLKSISASGPRQCISLIDACRNNPGFQVPTSTIGLASIEAPLGFFVGFSAGTGQLALDGLGDGDRSQNSLFARELLPRLSATRAIDEILRDTRHSVSRLAASVEHAQSPAIFDQTSQRLRLDGEIDQDTLSATTSSSVQLIDTAALIVAVDGIDFSGEVQKFPGTLNDADYVYNALLSLGVRPALLVNPTLDVLRSELNKLASRTATRSLLYLAAPGGFDGDDGFVYIRPSVDVALPRETRDAFFYGDLVKPFESRSDSKLIILADTGLIPRPALARRSDSAYLSELVSGPWITDAYNTLSTAQDRRVAVLSSCGLYQGGYDQADRAINSPFALAIDNALARPGIRLDELHAVVREQVETLTARTQSPVLFANGPIRSEVLVELSSRD
jgi:hypothetical protein